MNQNADNTDSVQATGRNSAMDDGRKATDATNLNYMNYDTFKKALVRISIIGCEYLGGQSEEAARKLAEMNDKRNQDA